jgi:hypothetical protein
MIGDDLMVFSILLRGHANVRTGKSIQGTLNPLIEGSAKLTFKVHAFLR